MQQWKDRGKIFPCARHEDKCVEARLHPFLTWTLCICKRHS